METLQRTPVTSELQKNGTVQYCVPCGVELKNIFNKASHTDHDI